MDVLDYVMHLEERIRELMIENKKLRNDGVEINGPCWTLKNLAQGQSQAKVELSPFDLYYLD